MGKALFSASKTLGDPSALRPQGDKKRAGDKKERAQGDRKERPFAGAQGDKKNAHTSNHVRLESS